MTSEDHPASLSAAKVEIYTWQSCPLCLRVKSLFETLGAEYIEHPLAEEEAKRHLNQHESELRELPRVVINDVLVGGLGDLMLLEESGELGELLFPTQ